METDDRRQFNVLLPDSLIREVKIAAVNDGSSLSRFVEAALRAQLVAAAGPRAPKEAS
jgi:predicted HicB family RNase H-like nuclease